MAYDKEYKKGYKQGLEIGKNKVSMRIFYHMLEDITKMPLFLDFEVDDKKALSLITDDIWDFFNRAIPDWSKKRIKQEFIKLRDNIKFGNSPYLSENKEQKSISKIISLEERYDLYFEKELKAGGKQMKVPLNIVLTYPVRWGKYEILRDFIQNFYDSVSKNDWKTKFQYSYDEQAKKLSMWIDKNSFSYEWLMHIGASTKTGASEENAGYFGEGFKIASLCALRDFDWDITMSSADWILCVITYTHKIDNQNVEMLAYDIKRPVENENKSLLILGGITKFDYELFKTTLLSFYYPNNPLFGKKIWENASGAIYERSNLEVPSILPSTLGFDTKGLVYCGYQLLGSCPFNLVVCLHHSNKDDRERKSLYRYQVIKVFESLVWEMNGDAAIYMLETMRRYWNSNPKSSSDIHSWGEVIDSLIYKISNNRNAKTAFLKNHPNLLVTKKVRNMREKNRRSQAKAWLDDQFTKYVLVKEKFQDLGYKTLEEECEINGGFVLDDTLRDEKKIRYVNILKTTVMEIFENFFMIEKWPEHRLILNDKAVYSGMATIVKRNKPKLNSNGKLIRYDIIAIYLKERLFNKNSYHDILATYIHELCHTFGGDKSASFSYALTDAIELLLKNPEVVEKGRIEWENVE